jgi:hypothetical protein
MKFQMMKGLLAVAAMIPLIFALSACGKKDEGGAVAVVPTATTYYTANGQCYQANTTTVVASSLCTNTGYYQSGGICYQTGTNTVVSSNLCTQTTGNLGTYPVTQVPPGYYPGTGGTIGGYIGGSIGIGGGIGGGYGGGYNGGYGGYCQGWFYQPGAGWGVCNGYNCHAMVLYNAQGQPVYCP